MRANPEKDLLPTAGQDAKFTVPDRIAVIVLMTLALPAGPLLYLIGRYGLHFMLMLGGVFSIWLIIILGFWFLLGAGAARYRGCRAVAFRRRLVWWGAALAAWYLPWLLDPMGIGCLHRLKASFTPEVIAAVRAASLRELARHPEGAVDKVGHPAEYRHNLSHEVADAIAKAGINRWDLYRGDDPLQWEVELWEASHAHEEGRFVGIRIPGGNTEPSRSGAAAESTPDHSDGHRSIIWHDGTTLFF